MHKTYGRAPLEFGIISLSVPGNDGFLFDANIKYYVVYCQFCCSGDSIHSWGRFGTLKRVYCCTTPWWRWVKTLIEELLLCCSRRLLIFVKVARSNQASRGCFIRWYSTVWSRLDLKPVYYASYITHHSSPSWDREGFIIYL